ncbi:MAG: DUF2304 domain-containing protein [Candidatus Riflebacteria bacterium]|nr:DUF2304 domain-containing protein [Candidatus Riflebacteria bacterium]
MQSIQIISIIGSLLFLITIIELIRRKLLKEAYAIIWLIFGCLFLFFSLWRKALDYIAQAIDIVYPPAMLFLLLIVAITLVLIQFSVVISKQSDQIKKLTQDLAILKQEKNENERK